MRLFIPVAPSALKDCQLCGEKILFVERREGGLWFPTDAIQEEETGSWGYYSRGPLKEVSLLHRCFGDPSDPTTVNGQRVVYFDRMQVLQERINSFSRVSPVIRVDQVAEHVVNDSDEYQRLIDEYQEVQQKYRDCF